MTAVFIFSLLAGICNAAMDTILFHPHYEIFYWLYRKNEKLYRWVMGDKKHGRFFTWFLWDGWHCAKTAMLLFVAAAILGGSSWKAAAIFLLGWGIGFNGLFEGLRFFERRTHE